MNKQFIINVTMKVHGGLSDITDYIEEFKALGGSEYLQSTNIQRTVKSTASCLKDDDSHLQHGRTVEFKLLVPFVLDTDSPFKGYHVTPTKYVSKLFDEIVQCKKTKRLPETTEPTVDAQIIKNTFHKLTEDDYGLKQRWGKDKPLLEPNIVIR